MVEPVNRSIRVFPSSSEAYRAVADRLAELSRARSPGRSHYSIALSGGSTPERLFRLLATEYSERLDWSGVELGFADERAVGPDDPLSNFGLARRTLIDPLGLAAARVHRIVGETRPVRAASEAYERTLRSMFPHAPGTFDMVLLGMGPDGHTASLFPGASSLNENDRWVVEEPSPTQEPRVPRISLTLPALAAARRVVFLVLGVEKRRALSQVLGDPSLGTSPTSLPAARVRATEGVEWFIDADAASADGIPHVPG
jgi:6-phosphogluconolactonase